MKVYLHAKNLTVGRASNKASVLPRYQDLRQDCVLKGKEAWIQPQNETERFS